MADYQTRRVPIYRALNRADMLMGCERKPLLFSALLIGVLIFGVMSWTATLYGIVLWLIALWGLRQMGKADDQMTVVFLRHVSHKRLYPGWPMDYTLHHSGRKHA